MVPEYSNAHDSVDNGNNHEKEEGVDHRHLYIYIYIKRERERERERERRVELNQDHVRVWKGIKRARFIW
jgi:hypothetical protein